MEKFVEKIKSCLQNEAAFCTAVCPFHLDMRDLMAKMQRGGFNAAYRTYLNTVGFPGIVSQLCDEPCKNSCPRRLKDEAIAIRQLEQAAVKYARNLQPNSYNMPEKDKKIAIIGAGISGLACALRLAAKKYQVTVFEKSGRIGGHLWELLPPEVFLADIERQFMFEKYHLCLDTEITSLAGLDFDAIYIATGAGGSDFGLSRDPGGAFASSQTGVFLGGELCGRTIIEAIADGLQVVNAIERFLKTGSMNQPGEVSGTNIRLDPALIAPMEPVYPADGQAFTQEEALQEARRCLRCACDACVRHCDLMCYYSKFPKRIGEEVEVTIHPGTLDGNGTVATRLMSTCNQCGLCKDVCPQGIDTGDLLLAGHRIMRAKGAMPWAFHDFWLRDMAFSNGEAGLCRLPPGHKHSRYLFFPGCQLGASDPQYVSESYRRLLAKKPDTALLLSCCGAPAQWAGDEPLHGETIARLREQWLALGKPVAVFACPTCRQMFQRCLPEITGVFLYDLLLAWGDHPAHHAAGETVSVFDPCSSRDEPELQQTIRRLAEQAGFALTPLPAEGKYARCCSWGGQVSIANPQYSREVVKARISQNDFPYIAYCVNCRDIFAAAKKPVYHILDVLFGLHGSDRLPPTVSGRRRNRLDLKRQVLKEFWQEEQLMSEPENKIKLQIDAPLQQKLSSAMILESDIETVVAHCEQSGRKVIDPSTGHISGHLQIGSITYWVEYVPAGEGYKLFNAYSHRMSIEED